MLRTPDENLYQFKKIRDDPISSTMKLNILGLTCYEGFTAGVISSRFCFYPQYENKPMIKYKMRDTFQFKVNGGLTF
jgi:hypothetical protein